ncbi:tetratricopeptide repeat protein [Nibrella saemangeumensis]|uniref:Tetratricopeptide repeat protein n=1 Tax=Nibrella saemangeumensis TaxID=1084526 RepID=A0ABP8ME25_9BACT
MKMLLKTLMLASLTGLSLPSASAQTVNQATRQAMTDLEAKRPKKAEQALQQAAQQQPSPESYFFLGQYYLKNNQPDKAQAAFSKGAELDGKGYLNRIGLGGVALLRGETSQAGEIFAEAEKKAKRKNPDWLYRMAQMHVMLTDSSKRNPQEALRLINKVLDDSKVEKKAGYYIVKGDALQQLNKGGEAVSAYESALQLDAQNAYALTQIGRIFKNGKNYTVARDNFLKALSIDSTYTPAYDQLGDLYFLGRNYRSAAHNYKKVVDNSEANFDDTFQYAKMAFLAKDYPNMMAYLDRIKDDPQLKDSNPVRRMYAYAYVTEDYKKYDEALKLMQELINSTKEDEQFTMDYAAIGRSYANLEGEGNDSLAIVYLTKATADTTENLYDDIASIYYGKMKKYNEAARAYQKAIEWKEANNKKPVSQDYYNVGRSAYFGFTINKDSTLTGLADSSFAKLYEVNPTYTRGLLWRARINRYMPDDSANQRATEFYQTFAEVSDTDSLRTADKTLEKDLTEAYGFLGYQAYQEKDYDKAVAYFNKTLALDPEHKTAKQLMEFIDKNKLANTDRKASDEKTASSK